MSARQNQSDTGSPAAARSQARIPSEAVEIGFRLFESAYAAWVAAEAESGEALRGWFSGTTRPDGQGYFAYRAALDREEAAALDLQRLCELGKPGHPEGRGRAIEVAE